MYEGWFEWFIKPRLFLKMGRQTLSYDDQRLCAAPNWSCTGMAHDVLLVKFKGEKFNYHTGFAYNNSADALFNADYMYSNSQNYKALAFSWFEVPIKGSVVLSGIGVVDFFEEAEDYNRLSSRITYGGNLIYKNDISNLEGSLAVYFQAGKTPHKVSGSGYSDLKAFLLAANVCFSLSNKLIVKAGMDYYSGSKDGIDPGESNTFNRLYGSLHAFNGSMEYFVTLPQQGLIGYYTGLECKYCPGYFA